MALRPKLLIIGERYTCSSDQEWLDRLSLLHSMLPEYPAVALQIRAKENPLLLLEAARQLTAHSRCLFNTSLQQAEEQGWSPIHLPESALNTPTVSVEFGASIHSLAALQKGSALGASYLLFGPIFDPRSKKGVGVGLAPLRAICDQSTVPILAVGGITPENTPSVLAQGAYGVASAGWIMQARSPRNEIERFLLRLGL